jgi:curved DNA-binding protein CbpA
MIELHKAYQALGLDPGTSFESIKRRYKRLVIVWHPDRMPNDAGRCEAEEELKKINHSYDLLRNHFEKHHKPGNACGCQPQPTVSNENRQGPGDSGQRRSTNAGSDDQKRRQEQEAKRREEERRRRAEEEARQSEAARKAEDQRRTGDTAKDATEQALQQEQALKDEKLRWQAALAAGMAFVLILGFGWLGIATRTAIGEIQRQWHNPFQPETSQPAPLTNGSSTQPTTPIANSTWIPL